jgi:hypothetical protein
MQAVSLSRQYRPDLSEHGCIKSEAQQTKGIDGRRCPKAGLSPAIEAALANQQDEGAII